uniref:Serine/threonine-protein kinase HT1 n=1 Tax=Solanum tuberosum TaxID=4113 RepID=M1B0U1_SOLTU
MDTQPFNRSRIAFRLTSPEWRVSGRPSLMHSSYFSRAETMSVKSGLFEGFAAQQRLMRCASAG